MNFMLDFQSLIRKGFSYFNFGVVGKRLDIHELILII